jgi:hypothetical protein
VGGGGILEDMCYERRRAEVREGACIEAATARYAAHRENGGDTSVAVVTSNARVVLCGPVVNYNVDT